MAKREINTKMKEIKAALKEIGFKKSRDTLSYDYNYEVGGHYSLHVKIMPEQPFCPVQLILTNDYHDTDYYDYYEDDMSISAAFAPDKLNCVIPAVKKSIKILENMNKKFKQIMGHLEEFEKLSAI